MTAQQSLLLTSGTQTPAINLTACTLSDVPENTWFYVRTHTGKLEAYNKQRVYRRGWPADTKVFVEVAQ